MIGSVAAYPFEMLCRANCFANPCLKGLGEFGEAWVGWAFIGKALVYLSELMFGRVRHRRLPCEPIMPRAARDLGATM